MLDVRTWRGADAGSDYELVVTRIMVKFMCGGGGSDVRKRKLDSRHSVCIKS